MQRLWSIWTLKWCLSSVEVISFCCLWWSAWNWNWTELTIIVDGFDGTVSLCCLYRNGQIERHLEKLYCGQRDCVWSFIVHLQNVTAKVNCWWLMYLLLCQTLQLSSMLFLNSCSLLHCYWYKAICILLLQHIFGTFVLMLSLHVTSVFCCPLQTS